MTPIPLESQRQQEILNLTYINISLKIVPNTFTYYRKNPFLFLQENSLTFLQTINFAEISNQTFN